MLTQGIYEQLISQLIEDKLNDLDQETFYIDQTVLDRAEAAHYLSLYLSRIIKLGLNQLKGYSILEKQIEITNRIIQLIAKEIPAADFGKDLVANQGKILNAIFSKKDATFSEFQQFIKEITPVTGLIQSELFTGGNIGYSLDGELKKEIRSADEIKILVSFIKWSGIRIFEKEFREFAKSGKSIKVITTSYTGATDVKAVEFLANLPNTKVKISYNTQNERLHAKAFLFLRNTGFHTGYIGSSNISHSALTKGLEWNLKVTTKEIGHIIEKFKNTFDTYWEDSEFEHFNPGEHSEKLATALKSQKFGYRNPLLTYFDLKPYPFQQEILDQLEAERTIHGRKKNLIVAATGTGKTMISGFDFQRYLDQHPGAKLLFVAHRKEILEQAQGTFQAILKNNDFGELWVANHQPSNYDMLFVSVQTLKNHINHLPLSKDFYDFIIVDEVHHIKANSYRPILSRFQPEILLGLTATPERMDGANILTDFCDTIAAEIRLPEALNRKLLCPFQYFGLSDNIDISDVNWKNGRYIPSELTKRYTSSDRRVSNIINQLKKYVTDLHEVQALGYCVSKKHAAYMAEKFTLAGLKAAYLTSDNTKDRTLIRKQLMNKTINYLFVVDIFNEGIDIPEIDTVLFLRPTESLTIFLQQLGRGLRLAKNKECLTVLDFVGNARPEYDFAHKFRAMVGKTHSPIDVEIEKDFPTLPLGCAIVLEKKARRIILDNIRKATRLNINKIIARIQNFSNETNLPLSLKNFLYFTGIPIEQIYKKQSWSRLCVMAGVIADFKEPNEKEIYRALSKKWINCQSTSYFRFILKLIEHVFNLDPLILSAEEQRMAMMLHYDIWQKSGKDLGYTSLKESLLQLQKNPLLMKEMKEAIAYFTNQIHFVEKEISLPFAFPLKLYSRYNRDQILAALGLHRFEKASSNREGNAINKDLHLEALFVTLKKSEKDFSPTTMYEDFALSEYLFHWQTRNAARPERGLGLSYIEHQKTGKNILLFIREQHKDANGNTLGFVCLGKVNFVNYSGSKPMNITWHLEEPMPAYLWKDSAKMAVG